MPIFAGLFSAFEPRFHGTAVDPRFESKHGSRFWRLASLIRAAFFFGVGRSVAVIGKSHFHCALRAAVFEPENAIGGCFVSADFQNDLLPRHAHAALPAHKPWRASFGEGGV